MTKQKLVAASLMTLSSLIFTCSCTTKPVKMTETVLERSGHVDKRPDWLNESEPVKMTGEQMSSLGEATIPVDYDLDHGFDTAEYSAKKGIVRELDRRLQMATATNVEEADVISNKTVHFLSSKMQRSGQYWEKISAHGEGTSESADFHFYRLFTLVTLSKADLQDAMSHAVNRATEEEGIGKLSAVSAPAILADTSNALAVEVKPKPVTAPVAASVAKPVVEPVVVAPVAQPQVQVAEQPAERAIASSVTGSFTVQVYAFGKETRAQRVTKILKEKGLQAFYTPAEVGGQTFYRVEVGHYKSRQAALLASDEVMKKGGVETAFAQKIKP